MKMVSIEKAVPARIPTCKACGKQTSGDFYKITIPSQKGGVWAHAECLHTLKAWDCTSKQVGSSKRCKYHVCEVIVPATDLEGLVYGNIHGFSVEAYSPTHRKLVAEVFIKHQATKVVKWAFAEGLTVKVNGQKVNSYSEYRDITTRV